MQTYTAKQHEDMLELLMPIENLKPAKGETTVTTSRIDKFMRTRSMYLNRLLQDGLGEPALPSYANVDAVKQYIIDNNLEVPMNIALIPIKEERIKVLIKRCIDVLAHYTVEAQVNSLEPFDNSLRREGATHLLLIYGALEHADEDNPRKLRFTSDEYKNQFDESCRNY